MTPKPKNTGEHFLKKFSFLVIIFLLLPVFFFFYFRSMCLPVDPDCVDLECKKTFIIPQNQDLSTIASRLQEEGLVKNSLVFKLLALQKGFAKKIQAGSFYLKPSMSAEEILENLIYGKQDVWITFPEGWRRQQYADRIKANLADFQEEEFLKLTQDLEGFLFPDTYLFPKDISAQKAVEIMTENFNKKWQLVEKQAQESKLSQKEIITLASIIEREVKQEQDRKLVAGILLKRLEADWPLQVDATVQFVKADLICATDPTCNWWPKVNSADLGMDSPYNTYKFKGLPPGPICNPGISSIKAVLFPQFSNYWFYLTGNDGEMYYAQTSQEHSKNINRHLR